MKKGLSIIGVFLFLLVLPFISVSAEAKEVGTFDELKKAVEDTSVDSITLKNNIDTTEKLNVTRALTIDGAGYTLTYKGNFGSDSATTNTTWGGVYVLQVYNTTATIKNISLTGGNAALLVNGSTVTLEGTIDVSGNGFGGIELGKGTGVTTEPKLVLKEGAKLVNSSESTDKPTVWADKTKATISVNGVSKEFDASSTQVKLTVANVEDIAPEVKVETSKDSNVAITDGDVADVFNESLKADETLKNLLESEGDVTVELVAKDATATVAETKKFEDALTDGIIAGYVDIDINVTKGNDTKHLTELTQAINLLVQLPEMPELEEGYERSYYILREHNGKIDKIEATLSEDGSSLLFASDKFSKYAVVYVDTKIAEDETEEAPETLDAGLTYVGLAVLSLGATIISVKKLRNN